MLRFISVKKTVRSNRWKGIGGGSISYRDAGDAATQAVHDGIQCLPVFPVDRAEALKEIQWSVAFSVDPAETRESIFLGFEVGDRGGGGGGDGAQAVHEATATPQRLLRSPRPSTACSPICTPSFSPRSPRRCAPHHHGNDVSFSVPSSSRVRLGWGAHGGAGRNLLAKF